MLPPIIIYSAALQSGEVVGTSYFKNPHPFTTGNHRWKTGGLPFITTIWPFTYVLITFFMQFRVASAVASDWLAVFSQRQPSSQRKTFGYLFSSQQHWEIERMKSQPKDLHSWSIPFLLNHDNSRGNSARNASWRLSRNAISLWHL